MVIDEASKINSTLLQELPRDSNKSGIVGAKAIAETSGTTLKYSFLRHR